MIYYFEGKLLVLYVVVCIVSFCIVARKTTSPKLTFGILYALLCVYVYFVIKLSQFPIYAGELFAEDLGGQYWRSINLIPFKESLNMASIQNVILTMPFGFLVPLFRNGKIAFKHMLVVAVLTGLVLELGQLMQLLINTFTFRVIDVNDVLFNFIGVMLGYLCFKVLRTILMRLAKKHQVEANPIVIYFESR